MDTDRYLPNNADDYIHVFRTVAALVNKAMDNAEETGFVSDGAKTKSLQRLAEAVETVACLRGDSGLFERGRPDNLSLYQKEMYQTEDMLRARLLQLGYSYPQR